MLATLDSTASILLRRADDARPLARVTVTPTDVMVQYGRLACGQLIASEQEYLSFTTYPELADVWDGHTWDIEALYALISPALGGSEKS